MEPGKDIHRVSPYVRAALISGNVSYVLQVSIDSHQNKKEKHRAVRVYTPCFPQCDTSFQSQSVSQSQNAQRTRLGGPCSNS